MTKYYYEENGEKFGPFTIEELKSKGITKKTSVWTYSMFEWAEAGTILDFASNLPEITKELASKSEVPIEVIAESKSVEPTPTIVPVTSTEEKTSNSSDEASTEVKSEVPAKDVANKKEEPIEVKSESKKTPEPVPVETSPKPIEEKPIESSSTKASTEVKKEGLANETKELASKKDATIDVKSKSKKTADTIPAKESNPSIVTRLFGRKKVPTKDSGELTDKRVKTEDKKTVDPVPTAIPTKPTEKSVEKSLDQTSAKVENIGTEKDTKKVTLEKETPIEAKSENKIVVPISTTIPTKPVEEKVVENPISEASSKVKIEVPKKEASAPLRPEVKPIPAKSVSKTADAATKTATDTSEDAKKKKNRAILFSLIGIAALLVVVYFLFFNNKGETVEPQIAKSDEVEKPAEDESTISEPANSSETTDPVDNVEVTDEVDSNPANAGNLNSSVIPPVPRVEAATNLRRGFDNKSPSDKVKYFFAECQGNEASISSSDMRAMLEEVQGILSQKFPAKTTVDYVLCCSNKTEYLRLCKKHHVAISDASKNDWETKCPK